MNNRLSIITINYNNKPGLVKTLLSLQNQTSNDYEFILVDGASEDGSMALLQSFSFPSFIGISEPDSGIYNAMNKGILKASGEFVLFLNSGDVLYDNNVIEKLLPMLRDSDVYYGDFYTSEGVLRNGFDEQEVTFFALMDYTIHHSGCALIRRTLFHEYGLYDEALSIVSDWKWFLNSIGFGKASVEHLSVVISVFDTTGISSIEKDRLKLERAAVIEELVPPMIRRDYEKYYELLDSKLQQERSIRSSWPYRIGYFVLLPIKLFRTLFCAHDG